MVFSTTEERQEHLRDRREIRVGVRGATDLDGECRQSSPYANSASESIHQQCIHSRDHRRDCYERDRSQLLDQAGGEKVDQREWIERRATERFLGPAAVHPHRSKFSGVPKAYVRINQLEGDGFGREEARMMIYVERKLWGSS